MADDVAPLASLSLTHVYYDPSDPISYLCAWLALVPQALCVVYATLVWSSREAEVALMFAGQLASEAANFVLKRLIREERPRHSRRAGLAGLAHGKGYGMPSSHAQFVAFWAVAVALFLLARHRPLPYRRRHRGDANGRAVGNSSSSSKGEGDGKKKKERDARSPSTATTTTGLLSDPHRPWSLPERAAISALALVLAALVAWSRVYLGYHTPRQVLAGVLAGSTCAAAWFAATVALRRLGLLARALDHPLARWFRFRDLVVEEDLAQAGWTRWEDRREARLAAKDE